MKAKGLLFGVLILVAGAANAQMMSRGDIENKALFLTDRMAYYLGLTNNQADDVYQINYDFLYYTNPLLGGLSVGDAYSINSYNNLLNVRNDELYYVLSFAQWQMFTANGDFYRPIVYGNRSWRLSINFVNNRFMFFHSRPLIVNHYRGGLFIGFNRGHGYFAPKGVGRRPGNMGQRPGNMGNNHNGNIGNRPGGNHNSGGNVGNSNSRPSGNHNSGGNVGNSNNRPSGNHNSSGNVGNSNSRPSGNHNSGGNVGNSNNRPSGNHNSGSNVRSTVNRSSGSSVIRSGSNSNKRSSTTPVQRNNRQDSRSSGRR